MVIGGAAIAVLSLGALILLLAGGGWFVLTGAFFVLSAASFVCGIIILISAFHDDVTHGLLCLFIPFYSLYYAFAVFEHKHKGPILLGWLGCSLGSMLLMCSGQTIGMVYTLNRLHEHRNSRMVEAKNRREAAEQKFVAAGCELLRDGAGLVSAIRAENAVQITDDVLADLKEFRWLRSISLAKSRVTDKGLSLILQMPAIRDISLTESQVSGRDIVLTHSNLRLLDFTGSQIDDQGLLTFRNTGLLQELKLGGNQITGSGFVNLHGLHHLRHLDLSNNAIDDKAIQSLPLDQRSNLQTLVLTGTNVTEEGVARIKEKLRHCNIVR